MEEKYLEFKEFVNVTNQNTVGPILTVWNASEKRQAQVALWAVLWLLRPVQI